MILIHPPIGALDVEYVLLYRSYSGLPLYLANVENGHGLAVDQTSAPTKDIRRFESINKDGEPMATMNREEFEKLLTLFGSLCQQNCNAIYPGHGECIN